MTKLVAGLEPYQTHVGQARLTCFKPGTSRIKTIVKFARLLHEWDRVSCFERMYPVNLMMKMYQVVLNTVNAIHNINRK